jgi:hypothetical protein
MLSTRYLFHAVARAGGVASGLLLVLLLLLLLLLVLLLLPVTPARAQHAFDDPVASGTDAFGLTLGLESIGIYGPGGVRGFNPQTAGDIRIDGLYSTNRAPCPIGSRSRTILVQQSESMPMQSGRCRLYLVRSPSTNGPRAANYAELKGQLERVASAIQIAAELPHEPPDRRLQLWTTAPWRRDR